MKQRFLAILLGVALSFSVYASLETGDFIDDLVITNPTGADDYATADDHLRLIKKVVQASFPNINGAVTSSVAELNLLDGVTSTTAELNLVDGITAIQEASAKLDELAALADTDGNFIVGNGSAWVNESGATVRTSLGVGTGDSPQLTAVNVGAATDTTVARVSAGVISVEGDTILTTVTGQPLDTELSEIAALANTNSNFIVGTGTVWTVETGNTARSSLGLGTGHSPQFAAVNIGHASDTTVTRVSAGVIAVEGVTIATISSGSFTVTWDDACTTSPADTWKYVKVGDMVTVMPQTDGINCTSDSAFFRTTGAELPAAIRPAIAKIVFFGFGRDNGVLARTCLSLATDGNISFGIISSVGATCSVSSWTSSAAKTGQLTTFSYILT